MSQFHYSGSVIAQAQEILRSHSSLDDKLVKLNGLMHSADTLKFADKNQISNELTVFLPRLAALTVDRNNVSDILMKNVLWQMLTHVVILNDLLEKSEEVFLSFVSTLFQLGFNVQLPWLFREGILTCLTELETTYPGLLVRELPRIYRSLYLEKTPTIQPLLVLFSLVLNHCCVLSYEIALDDLKQESVALATKTFSPNREGGVKLSFKYVISYRVLKSRECGFVGGDLLHDPRMFAVLKERANLCTPVASVYVRNKLEGFDLGRLPLSNNLLYLFTLCVQHPDEFDSIILLANSDFLSPSFKHMLLSWYLSFAVSSSGSKKQAAPEVLMRAVFCNSFDVLYKQLTCDSLGMSKLNFSNGPIEMTNRTDSNVLSVILRDLLIASRSQSESLINLLSTIFVTQIFQARKGHSSSINVMTCEALECFNKSPSKKLIVSFNQIIEDFCLRSENRQYKVSRLLGDFLPIFSELSFLMQDFNKDYLLSFCELVQEKQLSLEKASVFLYFFCSFLSLNPNYSLDNKLADSDEVVENLEKIDLEIAKLAVSLIKFCGTQPNIVPCSKKYLLTPKFSILEADDIKWTIRRQPMCEYASVEVPLQASVDSLPDFCKAFQEVEDKYRAVDNVRFVLFFDPNSVMLEKLCFGLSVELFSLSPFLSIDRKMVGTFMKPVLDFASIAENAHRLGIECSLDSLPDDQPFYEKLIARVSFSTGRSNIFSAWLHPVNIQLTDVLIPLHLTGEHCLGDGFVSSLPKAIAKMDSSEGWIESIHRITASSKKLKDSVFKSFVLFQADDYYFVGGFIPPTSLLFINFRFGGAVPTQIGPSSDIPNSLLLQHGRDNRAGSVNSESSEVVDANRQNISEFINKYADCCFAFVYTNNTSLLRPVYLSLEHAFNQD